jgi:hypothetical protein
MLHNVTVVVVVTSITITIIIGGGGFCEMLITCMQIFYVSHV